ncbi:hypothetical protein PVAND_007468 [Polypedilum vanderplanki]|uniref:Zinc finger protein n=1 Tax=Polypedilum vanderplanki TaxID=319348 RepID=A0A9J6C6M0_POLVA|nr:hypothetical protein PVAND_007468 [Polypedilum vanderplanki]
METSTDTLFDNSDLKKLCRMCLKNEKILKSMFYCTVGDFSYAKVYEQCTGYNISKEYNSTCTSICSQCENDLLFVFEFKQKMQENEEKLEQLLLLKRQKDHNQNSEVNRNQFLDIDDHFLDYQIESLDELEKSFSECKFKSIINDVKCITCLNNCETEKAINSLNSHDSYSILCECGTLLNSRSNFLIHYNKIHSDKKSSDEQNIRLHCNNNNLKTINKNHHNDDDYEKYQSIWRCLTCNLKFIRETSLQRHLSTAHQEDEYMNEYVVEKIDVSTDIDTEIYKKKSKKPITCPICGVQFKHRSTKSSHMARNHGTKKAFECNICNYSTLKRDRYQAHIDKHANPDKTFECSICYQKFNSLNTMNLHRAKHSSNSPTFLCSHCKKIFLDKRNYEVHLRLHTRENLFYCEICNRGFNRKEHLKNHYLKRKNNCDKYPTSVQT